MKKALVVFAAATMLLGASVASAAPFAIGQQVYISDQAGGIYGPTPPGQGVQSTTVTLNGGAERTVPAGMFVLDYSTDNSTWHQFLTFCLDPQLALAPYDNPYAVVTLSSQGLSVAVIDALSALWGQFFAGINSSTTSAAFQIAVWELAYGNSDFNVATGDFTAAGSAAALAQTWIEQILQPGGERTTLGILVPNPNNTTDRQRLLVEVPEPATLALLGLGLLGIGFAKRRKV